MYSLLDLGIELVERGILPDWVTRSFIRRLCADRLLDPAQSAESDRFQARARFLESLRSGPVAPVPEKANDQHYELPAEFFAKVLGAHRKYSCCYFSDEQSSLDQAEENSLETTCRRAELANGQKILELGCGWGSLSLWMAEHYPESQITAVSNSASQRLFIENEMQARGIGNLRVITADMNDFSPPDIDYDRVVSVEMFEHMRNYRELLDRVRGWLAPGGKLFVHIFCHRRHAYPFETTGSANWMGRYFFTGGIMPSADLLTSFDDSMVVTKQWKWSGRHYQRTANAWLTNLDARKKEILPILRTAYGAVEADRWFHRWRMFFLAVSEVFGYNRGTEWLVSHYLLEPVQVASGPREQRCLLSS